MKAWSDLSIAQKVLVAFVAMFALSLGLGLFGLSRTSTVNTAAFIGDVRAV